MSEQHQSCDSRPAVTPSAPGGICEKPLHVTVVEAITTNHTFTLVFPGKAVAVLHVHGPLSWDEARAFAASVLPNSSYEVRDGDETHPCVAPFHAWTCAAAQETLSLQKAQEVEGIRRLTHRMHMQMRDNALHAWISGEAVEEQLHQRKRNLSLLRNMPAEARAAWLNEATDEVLAELCGEVEAVIDGLQTRKARFTEQEREQHLQEAKALEDALELEEMRRLVTRAQIALTRQSQEDTL